MKREMIILLAAALLGVAAIALNQRWARQVEVQHTARYQDQVEVTAIRRRVEANGVLEDANLIQLRVPRVFSHPQAVAWADRADVIGRRLRHPMQGDQPLLWSDLAGGARRGLGDAILPGWGVLTVPIDLVGGVSGLITPGARIDLYGIFRELPGYDIAASSAIEAAAGAAAAAGSRVSGDLREIMGVIDQMQVRQGSARDRFYVQFLANNLGVFAVGARTQLDSGAEETGASYATISFAVPHGMQVALIMAAQKAQREGGKLICVLRSNESADETSDEAKPYASDDFVQIVRDAMRLETK